MAGRSKTLLHQSDMIPKLCVHAYNNNRHCPYIQHSHNHHSHIHRLLITPSPHPKDLREVGRYLLILGEGALLQMPVQMLLVVALEQAQQGQGAL